VTGTDSNARGGKSIGTLVNELVALIVAYVTQQTIVPIRSLGRYLLFGIAGALFMGIGGGLLGLAAVRLIQAETGHHLRGSLTWASYAGGLLVTGIGAALSIRRIARGSAQKVNGRNPS
jgi:hypothetical protein